jgi:hypothetical protein
MKDALDHELEAGQLVCFTKPTSNPAGRNHLALVCKVGKRGTQDWVWLAVLERNRKGAWVVAHQRSSRTRDMFVYPVEAVPPEALQALLQAQPVAFPVRYRTSSEGYHAQFVRCSELIGTGATLGEAHDALVLACKAALKLGGSVELDA